MSIVTIPVWVLSIVTYHFFICVGVELEHKLTTLSTLQLYSLKRSGDRMNLLAYTTRSHEKPGLSQLASNMHIEIERYYFANS
jgi:hypothetical protein